MDHLGKSSRWWRRGLVSAGIIAPFLAVLLWMAWSDLSSAQGDNRSNLEFNHASTGFQLTGGHAQVVCERCHVQGVFRGTPTQCFQCHSPGGRVMSTFKPSNHLPTTVNCSSCHRTTNWVPAFFTHNGVAPGTCATCHNNSIQRGKPATHIPTTQSCDACHRPTMWTAVAFTHAGVTPGTCATCHNGVQATGKPANHIPTTQSCDSCHTVGTTWALARNSYDHTGITSGCADCHAATGSSTFKGLFKPANHIPTILGCETCHKSTMTFSGTLMNHSGVPPGTCATCHVTGMKFAGSIVTKPTTHFPTTAGCDSCHNTTSFGPGTPMNHTGMTTGCASCHATGMHWIGGIVTKPTNHFPTTAPCESCHTSTTSFSGTPFGHPGIAVGGGTCAACHTGTYVGVVGKPAMHITTSSSCDTCHKSLTSFTGISTPNHSTFSPPVTSATTCATANCHDGRAAVARPVNHITITTTQCGTCHRWPTTSPATFGPGTPMNHTGITTGCVTCHATGSTFFGVTMVTKPANHFPYSPTTTGCENCHNTVTFGPATPFTHAGISIGSHNCGTCHTGSYIGVLGKPAMHVTTSSSCDTCHTSLTTFAGISTPNHNTFTPIVTTATTCAAGGCHDGRKAMAKPANHIPVTTTQCGTCHRWPTTTPATFGPGTPMNHAGITTGCATCHGAGQSWAGGVVTKPSNHFPTTSPCELCHKSTTTFSGTVMNHTGITTGCTTCHGAGQSWAGGAVTKPSNHFPTTSPCEFCHKSTTTFSGTVMNHTGITTGCTTCHGVGQSWAGGIVTKPSNHFPTTSPCELCHKSTTTFSGTAMNHTGITTGCATCHGAGLSWAGGIMTKPANHFPTTAACELCHLSTKAFSGARMVHTTLTGIMPGGCNTCHEAGMSWVGGIVTRPRDHTGGKAAPNSCDKSGCHRGYSSF